MSGKPKSPRAPQGGAGYVKSVDKALALLEGLADTDDGVTLSELAQRVGLPPSTAHRLLTTLERRRFVKFDNERIQWSIGVQTFMVGNAFLPRRNLVRRILPFMQELMEQSGETTNLAVESQGEAVYLAQVECHEMMRASSLPGSRVLLHCSAVGKALLSAMPEAAVTRILHNRGLRRITAHTLVSPEKLRAELAEIRLKGYAFDNEEHAYGLRCVAAPIFDESGHTLAAISLSGPTVRITDDRVPELGALVARFTRRISAEFGGQVNEPRPAERSPASAER